MKRTMLFGILGLVLASTAMQQLMAQDNGETVPNSMSASEIGILPSSRRGIRVDVSERNPYAKRVLEEAKPEDSKSEAAQIIQILEGLRIRGLSRDEHGNVKTVLYGDLRLTEGAKVPQLLPGQNDELVVARVSNEDVELAWTVEAGNRVSDGRKILIPIELEPRIQIVLPGQFKEDKAKEKRKAWMAVKEGEEGKDSGRGLASDP